MPYDHFGWTEVVGVIIGFVVLWALVMALASLLVYMSLV